MLVARETTGRASMVNRQDPEENAKTHPVSVGKATVIYLAAMIPCYGHGIYNRDDHNAVRSPMLLC